MRPFALIMLCTSLGFGAGLFIVMLAEAPLDVVVRCMAPAIVFALLAIAGAIMESGE